MEKHAFLIIAHKIDLTLLTLLRSIDSPNHDVFLHFDKKAKKLDVGGINGVCKKSKLEVLREISVSWGGDTLISVEYVLLEAAMKRGRYDWFHLLSGSDLMLVGNRKFDSFFADNKRKNFVRIEKPFFEYRDRVRYFYPFQNAMGRNATKSILCRVLLLFQKLVGVNRHKAIVFQKGSQWFSIEKEFARFLLSKREWVAKVFRWTLCGDELFVQTVLINSPYKDSLYVKKYEDSCAANLRYIDWGRGDPHIWTKADFKELMDSGCFFARKFDAKVDVEIIQLIYEETCHENTN